NLNSRKRGYLAWIFANLLAAFLIDDIIQPSLDFPPRSAGSEKKN
ncbi:hypothetical protein, partial [Escherichia coli]